MLSTLTCLACIARRSFKDSLIKPTEIGLLVKLEFATTLFKAPSSSLTLDLTFWAIKKAHSLSKETFIFNAFDKRIISKSDYDVLFNSLELFSVIEHLKRLLGIKEFKSDSLSTPAVELFINNTGIESINHIGQEIEKSLSENSDLIQKLISELK